MGRDDWFRRMTWSPTDAEEFQLRLRRSRTDFHKAQYLRIQAGHLHGVGLHAAALSLLEQLWTDYPVRTELASAYELAARIHDALNQVEAAVEFYRRTIQYEAEFPNVRTGCELSYSVFVVLRKLEARYDEVLELLIMYEQAGEIAFPLQRYQLAAARALIAAERGEWAAARCHAGEAQAAAVEKHSGFRFHPEVGLVNDRSSPLAARLSAISIRL